MKKILLLMLVCIVSFSVVACGDSASKIKLKEMNAQEIIEKFQEGGFPLEDIIIYSEETDRNNLLGRPNQYTSKSTAYDSKVLRKALKKENKNMGTNLTLEEYKEATDHYPIGINIEVFNNNADAKARLNFFNDVPELSAEYIYLQDNVLIRITHHMTNDEAKVYEEALKDMAKGDMPKYKK